MNSETSFSTLSLQGIIACRMTSRVALQRTWKYSNKRNKTVCKLISMRFPFKSPFPCKFLNLINGRGAQFSGLFKLSQGRFGQKNIHVVNKLHVINGCHLFFFDARNDCNNSGLPQWVRQWRVGSITSVEQILRQKRKVSWRNHSSKLKQKKFNFHVSVGSIMQTEIPKLAFLRLNRIGTDFDIYKMNGQL